MDKFKDKDLFDDLLWSPEFEEIEEKIIDLYRWEALVNTVLKEKSSGKYFKVIWRKAATEQQEQSGEFSIREVEPTFVEATIYQEIETK